VKKTSALVAFGRPTTHACTTKLKNSVKKTRTTNGVGTKTPNFVCLHNKKIATPQPAALPTVGLVRVVYGSRKTLATPIGHKMFVMDTDLIINGVEEQLRLPLKREMLRLL
jgi:hypothetical protein